MQETLFISDLHLDRERPVITGLFLNFLQQRALHASTLYILGDLFETWIGDDDDSSTNQEIIDGLRQLTLSDVPVFLMHGNRDFLMGAEFEKKSGCRILPDPSIIDLNGTPTLLMHGDTLCTDDLDYIKFRNKVRSSAWQQEFLCKSLAERREIVNALRKQSREQTSQKPEELMDVNQNTVEQTMKTQGVTQLIHGHTHRPAVHTFNSEQQSYTRYVLGDWYKQGSLLCCDDSGCRSESLHDSAILHSK